MATNGTRGIDAAEREALVVRESGSAVIEVRGGDRLTWLNGLVTCDLAKLRPGDAVYGLAVAKSGRILADMIVVADESRLLLVVPAAVAESLRESLERYLVMEDAEHAQTDAVAWSVHGPRSNDALAAARAAGGVGGLVDRTGLGGAVVIAPKEREAAVTSALAAFPQGDANDWLALRVARGVPAFGADFDGATYPQEVGLEKTAVSFNKGCYLGQEVVCMLEMRGHVKRKLARVLLESSAAPPPHAKVHDASGAEVGEVTSAAPGDPAIALAMVKRAASEDGTELTIDGVRAKVASP